MDINDLMNRSDEEMMNISDFGDKPKEETENTEDTTEENQEVIENGDEEVETSDGEGGEDTSETDEKGEDEEAKDGGDASSSGSAEGTGDDADKTQEVKSAEVSEPDYKAVYEQIMKPFKANGHEIKLDSPEEVIKLMQMGANYTKKMQAIQPNLKVLRMLENNALLDETKLSHLIDISKGDKTALAKFLKDNSIEPLDIDTESAIDYKQGNHTVSDNEIEFQTVLDEVITSDSGQILITQMQNQWDQASKQAIFQKPELIRVLAQQAEDGLYGQIAAEVHRQKVLGNPQIASLPFLSAYQQVGQAMAQGGQLQMPKKQEAQSKVLAVGTAPKKAPDTNAAQAKAASPSAKNSGKAKVVINPLDGSDEDFLNAFYGKV